MDAVYWPIMSLKTLRCQLQPQDLQGLECSEISGISTELPESLQFAQFKFQVEISPLTAATFFNVCVTITHDMVLTFSTKNKMWTKEKIITSYALQSEKPMILSVRFHIYKMLKSKGLLSKLLKQTRNLLARITLRHTVQQILCTNKYVNAYTGWDCTVIV